MAHRALPHHCPAHKPLIYDGVAHLTPALFAELDCQARTVAGVPICVYAHHEDPKNFAASSGWAQSVRETPSGGYLEMTLIEVANQVDMEAFKTCWRPEMDWASVKPEHVYAFIVLHEVAHHLHLDTVLMWSNEYLDMLTGRPQDALTVRRFIEMRADRAAWSALYPGQPIPVVPERRELVGELERFYARHQPIFEGWQKREPREPITTEPGYMVPHRHAREGIPWSEVVTTARMAA